MTQENALTQENARLPAAVVARRICELGNWEVPNLKLQKLMYLANMFYSGGHPEGLIEEGFRAWDNGPVIPTLYHRCKPYGTKPIPRKEWNDTKPLEKNEAFEKQNYHLRLVFNVYGDLSSNRLIAYTHDELGAWAETYQENADPPIKIDQKDIVAEFKRRRQWILNIINPN